MIPLPGRRRRRRREKRSQALPAPRGMLPGRSHRLAHPCQARTGSACLQEEATGQGARHDMRSKIKKEKKKEKYCCNCFLRFPYRPVPICHRTQQGGSGVRQRPAPVWGLLNTPEKAFLGIRGVSKCTWTESTPETQKRWGCNYPLSNRQREQGPQPCQVLSTCLTLITSRLAG